MLKFIDKNYEKITWFIILLGLITIFTAKQYLTLVLFFYLLIRSLKSRDSIIKTLRTTPLSTTITYVVGMILLIAALTVLMLFSGSFLKHYNIPAFLQYIYIAVVLVGSMFFYFWFMDFLIKKQHKNDSRK
ncbi:hypothetical protein [Sporosarcina sp. FSL K6-1508]|uniref:hypothetical protein n=1 Tax=Sporosarcina sp. FSL K6-1508 TaxID=2921553 RepID=UPI0030F69D8B